MKQSLRILFLAFLAFSNSSIKAQTPQTYNSADIYLQLKKLNVLGSVLYIAAHPDDENTRLLAYLAKEKQYRTGYLSLTRGDGGQNLIGDEQGIDLGLIRTQELLAARRIDGAEQFFSRAFDFGFSKSSKEAMEIWGHDKILSDVVWVIRKFQPDVIITRFPGDERAGHGHHAASALLANEAFKAAADPNMFPEQLKAGVQPWQAKRILWNTFNFGSVNTTDSTQFKLDVGVYNNLLGKSYGEIASESRSQHKSQGFGVPRQRGQAFEYFLTTGGDAPKNDLMEGIDISWQKIKADYRTVLPIKVKDAMEAEAKKMQKDLDSLKKHIDDKLDGNVDAVQTQINNIISQYNFEYPERSTASLVNLYKSLQELPDGYWRTKKLAEVQQLIIETSGVFAEATANNEYAVQGDSINVQFFVNKRNEADVRLKKIQLRSYDTTVDKSLTNNQNLNFNKSFAVAVNENLSQPYWLAKPMQPGSFDVTDQQLIGKAQNDAAYTAEFTFSISGEEFKVERAVQYKFTDPVKGEVYQPLLVVPAITGRFDQRLYVFNGVKTKTAQLEIHSKSDFQKVNLSLEATSAKWKIQNGAFNNSVLKNTSRIIKATIISDDDASVAPQMGASVKELSDAKNQNFDKRIFDEIKILYPHIPNIIYFKSTEARLEKVNLKTVGHNIGYIVGAGDKVPQALQQMGYNITYLSEAGITDENLQKFDAVIAGVRVYNTQEWINSKYDVFMRYIQNGGNYIVQYNTANFISSVSDKIGPYPFAISRTRVTDENAEVKILQPNSTILNYPNKISKEDFNNWIQERSIYQAEKQDTHYEMPFAMHDVNESETNGSLIVTKYGKGNFVYTGLVFFRELPAGVPGAYRLMANLIALPQNK